MSYAPIPPQSNRPAVAHPARCGWFWAWVLVGAALGLGVVSFISVAVLPALVLGAIVWRQPRARASGWGLLTGTGLPLLLVAFLNRGGPGEACYRTVTSAGCDQLLNPIPWLLIGLALTLGGFVAQARLSQRRRQRSGC